MSDVVEGIARALMAVPFELPGAGGLRGTLTLAPAQARELAQAAMDYIKQPAPASKPTSDLYTCTERMSAEGQGPEISQEQIEAMTAAEVQANWDRIGNVWRPFMDVLKGDAP